MSLYCFGKLALDPAMRQRFVVRDTSFVPGRIDEGDRQSFEKEHWLDEDGIYFSIVDEPAAADATSLWLDAGRLEAKVVAETRFGRLVHALMFDDQVTRGAIAFADGGVQTVLRGSSEQCWVWFTQRIRSPWDAIDNPLMIWTRG